MIKNELAKTDLTLKDFWYDLPEERIAQTPLAVRDSSRLMVIHRETGEIEHRHFYDIIDYLEPTDTLVINDTRVIPARVIGHRSHKFSDGELVPTDSTAPVELLLLKQLENDVWEALAGPGKRAKEGGKIGFRHGIQPSRRLVEEQDAGGEQKQFGDREPGLFPAAEIVGMRIEQPAEREPCDEFFGFRCAVGVSTRHLVEFLADGVGREEERRVLRQIGDRVPARLRKSLFPLVADGPGDGAEDAGEQF